MSWVGCASGTTTEREYCGDFRNGLVRTNTSTAPDYSRTGRESVVVRLPTDAADLDFRRLVVEEERRRSAELPIDSLIALAALRELKRITADELASRIERDAASAKRTLEALTEAGLVEAHGATRARSYTLSAQLYQRSGDKAAYTRQAGFSAIRHCQLVGRSGRALVGLSKNAA